MTLDTVAGETPDSSPAQVIYGNGNLFDMMPPSLVLLQESPLS